MKQGDLVRILSNNAGCAGKIGFVVEYFITASSDGGEAHTMTKVLIEDKVMIFRRVSDWFEVIDEEG